VVRLAPRRLVRGVGQLERGTRVRLASSIFLFDQPEHPHAAERAPSAFDLQINLLAEQESTKTVALLERIAQHLNVPVPVEPSERELAAPTDSRDVISTLDSVLPADSCRSDPTFAGSSGNDDPEPPSQTDATGGPGPSLGRRSRS
jgi:hypothetical protein